MKLVKISLLFALMLSFTGLSKAQSSSKKKIVVVEKVTDENGVVSSKKIVKEGEEAEQYMREKKIELGLEKEVKHIEKEVEVEVRNSNVKEHKKIKIRVKDGEGEEKILAWDGEGEIPDEMKEYMEEAEIDIDVAETGEGEVRVVVKTSEEKPRLGVVPENHVDGVEIIEILEGSAAEKAGLKKGDIIYEVASKTVGSGLQLSAGLDRVAEGNSTTILILRDGVKKAIEVNL